MIRRALVLSACIVWVFSAVVACGDANSPSSADDVKGDGDQAGDGDGDSDGSDATLAGGATSSGGVAAAGGDSNSLGGTASDSGGGQAEVGGASTGDGGVEGGGGAGGAGGSGAGGEGERDSCSDGTCSGTCDGDSCEGEWICNTEEQICTDDIAQYCGCDGVTFTDSGSCPGQTFSHRGPCESGKLKDCSFTNITCRRLEPECPEPFTYPEVVDGCWGECIPVAECACTETSDCPDPKNIDETVCLKAEGTCSPLLN